MDHRLIQWAVMILSVAQTLRVRPQIPDRLEINKARIDPGLGHSMPTLSVALVDFPRPRMC